MRIGAGYAPGEAGFFSSAKRLVLPRGPASDPHGVRGYPIDFRVKAQSTRWPPDGMESPSDRYVPLAQYGLGCYERFLAGEGEEWFAAAVQVGRYLTQHQEPDGSWLNRLSFTHTFPLTAPWRCGMAQGEAASLLVRLHLETGKPEFAEAARNGLAPLWRSREQEGVCAWLSEAPWPEEYPTDPPSFVLNGAMFAWWGVRDVGVGLGDDTASRAFSEGVDSLASNLHRFDTGRWSLYCLYPHPLPTIASSFYHMLHITQLEAMHALAPRPQLEMIRERWISYFDSRTLRWRAFSQKALFRLVVPRNRLLAERLPWTRPGRAAAA
jgi:heparosan-N-sulfate-glucuronate 5-epimerase